MEATPKERNAADGNLCPQRHLPFYTSRERQEPGLVSSFFFPLHCLSTTRLDSNRLSHPLRNGSERRFWPRRVWYGLFVLDVVRLI